MEIHQLRTFLAILEHGSFSRAAEVLHVTQSTVSFHIKSLETAVGAPVLERRSVPIRATAAGAALEPYASRIVALRAEALSQLGQEIAGAAGNIIVAASTIPAAYLLPAAMARLRTERAGISVTVQVSDSSGALAALRSRDCHLAVVGARERDRRIVYTPVATDEVLLVAHPEDPMAHRPMDLDALARVPIILREEGSGTRLAVAALLARRAALGIASPTVRVGSTAAARQCVLQGLGMSFISRLAVAEDLAAGRLVELPVQGTPVRRRFHAAQLREGSPSAAVAALIGCLCGDS